MIEHTAKLEMNDLIAAFGLDRANIELIHVYHECNGIFINLTLNVKEHTCPLCKTPTTKIKDYRIKKIKHSVLNPTPCIINYRARRYICPVCHKSFYEDNPFTQPGSSISVATVYNVLTELKRPEATFSNIADKYFLSPSSVSLIFDNHIRISRRTLPECLCFDETYAFKSYDSDYICVLLDYTNKKIVDVLPSRKKKDLIEYFSRIPIDERKKVKYVSFDMWCTYRTVSKLMFPNCCCILDKFHVLQELSRRMQKIRVTVMNENKKTKDTLNEKQKKLRVEHKQLTPEEDERLKTASINYYLLKKFHFVLHSNDKKISDPNYEKKFNHVLERYCNLYDIYDLLIEIDPILKEAVEIKDKIHNFYKTSTHAKAKEELEEIIILCRTSQIRTINEFANTLTEWKQEIINSFIKIPSINKKMNNSLIENRNKSIKLLKHSSNGYTNWERFRKRVLYCLNDDINIKF